jgi:hypothetical protein
MLWAIGSWARHEAFCPPIDATQDLKDALFEAEGAVKRIAAYINDRAQPKG